MEFEEAIKHILWHEGGYANDADDTGGETRYGISKKAFPHIDIANLTKDKAIELYRTYYWLAGKCDRVDSRWRLLYFDTCVNMGVGQAVKFLQLCVNQKPDGIFGRVTELYSERFDGFKFLMFRIEKYINICLGRPTQVKYLKGWVKRALLVYFGKIED